MIILNVFFPFRMNIDCSLLRIANEMKNVDNISDEYKSQGNFIFYINLITKSSLSMIFPLCSEHL